MALDLRFGALPQPARQRRDPFVAVDRHQALHLLQEGNRRFVAGALADRTDETPETRRALAERGQFPFAVIVGCSDARVPPEIVFDVGLGQLFVIRTAGNLVDPFVLGSVEFAVGTLGARLVVVLGHRECGAVAGAIAGGDHGPNLAAIIAEIQPSLDKVRLTGDPGDVARRCEDENIRHSLARILACPRLAEDAATGAIALVGAKYDVASGRVDWWESVSD